MSASFAPILDLAILRIQEDRNRVVGIHHGVSIDVFCATFLILALIHDPAMQVRALALDPSVLYLFPLKR